LLSAAIAALCEHTWNVAGRRNISAVAARSMASTRRAARLARRKKDLGFWRGVCGICCVYELGVLVWDIVWSQLIALSICAGWFLDPDAFVDAFVVFAPSFKRECNVSASSIQHPPASTCKITITTLNQCSMHTTTIFSEAP
jgi:hypothetical protein